MPRSSTSASGSARRVDFVGQDRLQHGAHAGELQGAARECRADAAVAGFAVGQVRLDLRIDGVAPAVDGSRNAAGDRLAHDEEVGVEAVCCGVAAGAGTDGVGLVDAEERAVLAREAAQRVVVAIFGQDHAAVGHDGFGEHECDVVFRQSGFKRFQDR